MHDHDVDQNVFHDDDGLLLDNDISMENNLDVSAFIFMR